MRQLKWRFFSANAVVVALILQPVRRGIDLFAGPMRQTNQRNCRCPSEPRYHPLATHALTLLVFLQYL